MGKKSKRNGKKSKRNGKRRKKMRGGYPILAPPGIVSSKAPPGIVSSKAPLVPRLAIDKLGGVLSIEEQNKKDSEEIKAFNRDISLFNSAQFIIKSIFFGIKEENVKSHIEDMLFKILQRLNLKVKRAIDTLNNQEDKSLEIKDALDQHFTLFRESLKNSITRDAKMDKLEGEIRDFFKQRRENLENIKGEELKLEKTPNEFDKVTGFLKEYQLKQKQIVAALTNILKKVPKIGEKLFIFLPVAGDALNTLHLYDDAKDVANELKTVINLVNSVNSVDEPHNSTAIGGKKTKKRITTKKRRTTNTKKRRTTNTKKRRTKRRKTTTRRRRN